MTGPIDQETIRETHALIRGRVRRTPILTTSAGDIGLDRPVIMKLENTQHAGSFKTRGVFANLASRAVPPAGVAAASGGNHGAAVAYGAAHLGIPAKIFVPETSSPAKIARIRELGADLHVEGEGYADAASLCSDYVAETGAMEIHPYDSPATIAGQGTLALEWQEQALGLDTVLIAVGGGGLIAGAASWFGDRVQVIGVEPTGAATLHTALAAGEPVDVPVHSIAADSLGARRTGSLVFDIAQESVDDVLLVEDDDIRDAQLALWRDFRIAVEPGAATALAALACGAYRPGFGERVGVLVCGGNVDLTELAALNAERPPLQDRALPPLEGSALASLADGITPAAGASAESPAAHAEL